MGETRNCSSAGRVREEDGNEGIKMRQCVCQPAQLYMYVPLSVCKSPCVQRTDGRWRCRCDAAQYQKQEEKVQLQSRTGARAEQSKAEQRAEPALVVVQTPKSKPHASTPPGPPLGDGETKRDAADEQV